VAPNDSWEVWWNLSRLAYLPDRRAAFARRVVTPQANDDPRFWTHRRVAAAHERIVPFLRTLLEPAAKTRDDVTASALIALARTSNAPEDVALLEARLADPRGADIVRESAALSLGLLRRTEPDLQLEARVLDPLRDRLVAWIDDPSLSAKARAFCALSLGLLGDQPFASDSMAKDGRLVVRALWMRLGRPHARRDVPIALFTAMGLQPPAGVPDGVRESLRRLVIGRRVQGSRWDTIGRGHALAALLRLGGPGTEAFLVRTLEDRRTHRDLRRAAYLSLGLVAGRLCAEDRLDVARALDASVRSARDPLTRGLAYLAVGHLLGADLRAGASGVLTRSPLPGLLVAQARSGPSTTRGFSVLPLALAVRGVKTRRKEVARFLAEARALIQGPLVEARSTAPRLLAAYAVAAGLAGLGGARASLARWVADPNADPALRGHAAVALGQLGDATPEIVRVLNLALAEKRDLVLRRQAALALALLGSQGAGAQLLRQLETGRTERLLAQVVIALGRLGDLRAVDPLIVYASDAKRSELAQSLAVVALGLLGDPEPRPSLLRLSAGGFYPARTESLQEAYTIL